MKETKNIEDLIKSTKREKLDFNFDDIEIENKNITEKLENQKIVSYSDFSGENVNVIDVQKDLETFNYFSSKEESTEIENQEIEKSENKIHTLLDNIEDKNIDFSNAKNVVSFKNVYMNYGEEDILKNINLDIKEGQFVYLVGESGSGKSSMIKLLYRDIYNQKGSIFINGTSLASYNSNNLHLLRREIGVIFQDFKLLPDKTIYDNVNYSLEVTKYPKNKRKDQVLKTLKIVGLLELKDKYPNELSGGQQQRVAIARAIVDEPKIILADEPTGNLDPQNALITMNILEKINSMGTTIIMATHDVGIVNKYKNRVVLMKKGNVANESMGVYIYD